MLHYTELDPKEREDPMAVVFPKVEDCKQFTIHSISKVYCPAVSFFRKMSVEQGATQLHFDNAGVKVQFPQVRCLGNNRSA